MIRNCGRARLLWTFVLLFAQAEAAQAHDTWFNTRGRWWTGDLFLMLGTGIKFPAHDVSVNTEHLQLYGCKEGAKALALRPLVKLGKSLVLRTRVSGQSSVSCWAQLVPFDIELPPHLVAVYFEEAQAPEAVRLAWAAMQARGLPWKERYTKYSRIELAAPELVTMASDVSPPSGPDLAMDIRLVSTAAPLRAGDNTLVQVLRDGQPLADFAIELVSSTPGSGVWRKTDAHGRLTLQVPTTGRWLLRGIDIRPSIAVADTWDTRFVTLTFDVAAALPARLALRSR